MQMKVGSSTVRTSNIFDSAPPPGPLIRKDFVEHTMEAHSRW